MCNVVGAEMENYEPGMYVDRVMESVAMMRDQGIITYYTNHEYYDCAIVKHSFIITENK